MTHDETSKNHPGGLKDKSSFEKTARMYETESDTDGYRALSLYISKLNLKCEALFQLPRRDWNEEVVHNIWYENRPLGVSTLGSMMKEISIKAMLSKVYTNHCVRATAITLWYEAGLSDRHIWGHRKPSSRQHYNSSPSSTQLRKCSDVLSSALQGSSPTQLSLLNYTIFELSNGGQCGVLRIRSSIIRTSRQIHGLKLGMVGTYNTNF
ncbi:hypothetical protein P5673_022851 [Acropora cervicornis]|uniref:Uncharacterized protein n=1 Tax=Acropora cervicornis TaxID=6130 RepID=A0AAD9UZE1_ACRCE|nr:hypothetical protein P5673_022851 [Acropora cervicornis]